MAKVAMIAMNGCEEVEMLMVVDLVRRAGITMDIVSANDDNEILGSHNIKIIADKNIKDITNDEYDGLVIPGGMPGTKNLDANKTVTDMIVANFNSGKLTAAICAAPSVFGHLGILDGKKATCYPGFEGELKGAELPGKSVVADGNIITANGLGAAIDFAAEIITYIETKEKADAVLKAIQYK